MIVGNDVKNAEIGFESDQNEVILVKKTGPNVKIPRASKREIADRILDEVLTLRGR